MYWWEAHTLKEATNLLAYQTYYSYFGDYFYVFVVGFAFLLGVLSKNSAFGIFNALFYYVGISMLSFFGYIPVSPAFITIGGVIQAGAIIILALLSAGGYI